MCVLSHLAGGNTSGDLSEADLQLLRKWVNPAYLKPESWQKIAAKMNDDGSVQLQKFLVKEIADQILAAAVGQDKAEGVGGGKIPGFTVGYDEGELSCSFIIPAPQGTLPVV